VGEALLERDVYCLLGLPFDAIDMASAVERVRGAVARREPCFISTPNLNFLIGSRTDSGFRDSVIGSDLSIADGMPLVWAARLLGIPIRERVAGSGLFEQLKVAPIKVYFFGGRDGVAEAAARALNAQSSAMVCVGHESPGFGSVEELSNDESIARINASGADLLVVSLGAKKGQAWIERNRRRISVPAVSHLGAVLNFTAGTVQRAPHWMQRAGLEWLWRIKEEPALWRRYVADGAGFLRLLFTRLVPFAWWIRRRRPTREALEAATLEAREQRRTVIVLRGAWTQENLDPLRRCLATASAAKKDIRIDLADVTYLDSSFLGLLLVLYGLQKQNGKRLVCSPVSSDVRRVFEYGCSEFLLAPDDEGIAGTELDEEATAVSG